MRSLFLTFVGACLLAFAAHGQYAQNAIGLRLGGGNGFGGEASFQRMLKDNNRLELDLGLRGDNNVRAFRIVGIYQWRWAIKNGFSWFAGFGAGLGAVDYNNGFRDGSRDYVLLSIDGQVGIEYVFPDTPFQLALDTRPAFFVVSDDFFYNDVDLLDVAISVRYQFN